MSRRVDKQCNEDTCMKLPEGESCGTCVHERRCLMLGFTSSRENTSCDFFPPRFRRKKNDE